MKTFVTSANLEERSSGASWGVLMGSQGKRGLRSVLFPTTKASQTSVLFACVAAFTSLLVRNAETYSQPLCSFTTAWQPDLPRLWASSWWYLQVEAAVCNHTPPTSPLAPPPFASAPNRARGCCPLQRGRG